MKNRLITYFLAAFLLATTGCVKNHENSGYVYDAKKVAQIKAGDEKDKVLNILGSPSSQSGFGEEKWYYISMRSERRAFLDPDVVNQTVNTITFDEDGKVKSIVTDSENTGRDIEIVKDVTTTEGNDISLFEQLLGNLGKFNPRKEAD